MSLNNRVNKVEETLDVAKPAAGVWIKFVDPPYGGLPTNWREMSSGEERDHAPPGAVCLTVRYDDEPSSDDSA